MDIFIISAKWFWLIFIIVTFLNAGIFQYRAKKHIKENPELADGYHKIIKGFLIWGNIPWIIMGFGCTIGNVPTIFHYFRPRDGNPFVIAFFCSLFLIWIIGTYWIFFRNGAKMLVNHPGIFNYELKSPTMVKLLWVACLAGGILAVVMMFAQIIPVPIK